MAMKKTIWIILSISILLRLIMLIIPQDFWHDPAFTYSFSKETISFIIDSNDVHPPIYYFFIKFIMLFSSEESWMRGINIILWLWFFFGVYKLLSNYYPEKITNFVLIMLSFSPTFIYYSVEPRNYMMGLMFVIWQLYYFFNWLHDNNRKNISWLLIVFSILMLYTHYFTAFVLIVEGIYILNKKNLWWSFSLQSAWICFLSLPLVYHLINTLPKIQNFWFKPNSFLAFISSFTYQFVFADSLTILHITVGFLIIATIVWTWFYFNQEPFWYLLFLFPLLTLFSLNYFQSHTMYHHRFFLFEAIGLYVIISISVYNLWKRYSIMGVGMAFLIVASLSTSFIYTLNNPTNDLYLAQKFMKTQINPSDDIPIIHTATFSQTPFKYYFRDYNSRQLLITNMDVIARFTAGGSIIRDNELLNKSQLPQHFYYLTDSANPIQSSANAELIYEYEGLMIYVR